MTTTMLPPPSVLTDALELIGLQVEPPPRMPNLSRLPALYALVEETSFTDAQATVRPARRAS